MSTLLPDWLVAVSTMLALAVFVTGRSRLAFALATPAFMRFVIWPTILAVLAGIPVLVLVIFALLALPVVVVRAARRLLILFVGTHAADHALGHALGEGIVRFFRGKR